MNPVQRWGVSRLPDLANLGGRGHRSFHLLLFHSLGMLQRYIYIATRLGLTALGVGCALLSCTAETPMTSVVLTPLKPTVGSSAEEQTIESATSVIERPTDTSYPTSLSTSSTPPAMAGLPNALILYSTIVDMRTSPNRPPDVAPFDDYWAFKTLPPLPFLDPAVFDLFYGSIEFAPEGMSRFFHEVNPQLSPDGRYLLLPGLADNPSAGVEGTGLWLLDLVGEVARELLPDGKFATWNPTSDTITYVDGDTLYTLSIAEGAEPQPIFQHPDLWAQYAKWSPDGQWIATMTSSLESTDEYETRYAATYWLIPTNGGPARELTTQEAAAIEYSSHEMSWSADSQFLLVRNRAFDLDGNLLSPDYPGRVDWLPNESTLLSNGNDGLRIVSITGEEIAHISDGYFVDAWAFSRDGRRLAYSLPRGEEGAGVAVYDLERGEGQVIGTIAGADFVGVESVGLVRWSGDDSHLIMDVYRADSDRHEIWTLETQPESTAELVLEDAELIEVVPYPVH